MKIYLAGKIVSQMSTYCRVIQPTTSNNSCDRLNSKHRYQFSLVLLSFMETSHIHLIICISALSHFNPTSANKGLVSLP